jgi:hypothetical protein
MSQERTYYRLVKGGFAETVIIKFQADGQLCAEKWLAFAKKYKAARLFGGDSVTGLELKKEDVPEGWKSTKDLSRNSYRPLKRKVCLSAYNEFSSLGSKPNAFRLCKDLKIDLTMSGMMLAYPHYQQINFEFILSLPKFSNIPEGVIFPALKMSEYWALKESEIIR